MKIFLPVIAILVLLTLIVFLLFSYNQEENRYLVLQDNLDRLVLAMSQDGEADVAFHIQETENALNYNWKKYNVLYFEAALNYAKKGRFDDAVYSIQAGTALNARRQSQ